MPSGPTSEPVGPSRPYLELLAANLVRLRRDQGWSTRAFADHVRMSLSTLYEIEHLAYGTVSLGLLERLGRGLGVHPASLISPRGNWRPFPETPVAPTLAVNLVAARGERGWTQAETALRSGVGRAVIAHIERGERNPSLETLVRLAKALDIPVPNLISA